jgi:hypothetical protein
LLLLDLGPPLHEVLLLDFAHHLSPLRLNALNHFVQLSHLQPHQVIVDFMVGIRLHQFGLSLLFGELLLPILPHFLLLFQLVLEETTVVGQVLGPHIATLGEVSE